MGLNITVHSYEENLDIGLVSDRDLVPDLWDLADLHIDEVGRLFEATGAEWAVPQPPPAMRVGPHPVIVPTKKRASAKVSAGKGATGKPSARTSSEKGSTAKSSSKKTSSKASSAKKPAAKKPKKAAEKTA